MDQVMKKILLLAVRAPSGDNAQPWDFEIAPQKINLFLRPECDNSLYNYQQRAARLAIGAVIENIVIAANAHGLKAEISLFPDPQRPNLTATIALIKAGVACSPLLPSIDQRSTHRGKYSGAPLTRTQSNEILDSLRDIPAASVHLNTNFGDIKRLSRVAAINDRLIFENRFLHEFLFRQVRWNEAEVKTSCDGLDIETFELNGFDAAGFRLMSYWPLVSVLRKIGWPAFIAKQSEQTYRTSSGFGLVTIEGSDPESLTWGGRAMQRVWLSATMAGLSFQPIAGITCLIQRINHGGEKPLSANQVNALREIERTFKELWNISEDTAVMYFRVGHSAPPRARSLRRPLDQVVKEQPV